jgi:dihydrofolate reductase
MCNISIIAARSINNVIGNNNQLPWYLPSDLKHFKTLTENSVVVMGRKTYESIGKPLPSRINVVISSQNNLNLPSSVVVCCGPNEAIKASRIMCIQQNIQNVWIIGGAGIYQQFIKRADKMVLTTLNKQVQGDVLFPNFKPTCWQQVNQQNVFDAKGYIVGDEENKGIDYTIQEYERIQ